MPKTYPKASMVVACLVFPLLCQQARAQHPRVEPHQPPADPLNVAASSGPGDVKVELENESVQVLRIRLRPHEQTPMHEVSARVVVWLTGAHLRDAFPDGRSEDIRRAAGAIDWVPAQRHAGENLGDGPIEFLAIVPKVAPSPHPQ